MGYVCGAPAFLCGASPGRPRSGTPARRLFHLRGERLEGFSAEDPIVWIGGIVLIVCHLRRAVHPAQHHGHRLGERQVRRLVLLPELGEVLPARRGPSRSAAAVPGPPPGPSACRAHPQNEKESSCSAMHPVVEAEGGLDLVHHRPARAREGVVGDPAGGPGIRHRLVLSELDAGSSARPVSIRHMSPASSPVSSPKAGSWKRPSGS